ncbi:peptide/nickel transport system ATP-binding protein [Mycetocola sp. BIGb0189]|uniref:dipeptide ABC transporter ATP-binding protein n=1 Tax=Mycetocola sp. BIGb0189 TaxID=2940604 RepID=UPI00216755CC|nr:ABC transporter ATP-binding protein [Mycetocola sp. BIGb0189]MCS4275106.1 peptide/nickel transport system ATP-binding protein [Mycetocola sp. BIGb0189]
MTVENSEALVSVRDLTIDFGPHTAVSGLSFDLTPGRCVALVGESGSGKSVSARALLGLVGPGSRIEATELRLGTHDLRTLTPAQWRGVRGREVGLVLQDALVSLDPLNTIGAEVAESLRLHTGLAKKPAAEIVHGLLRRVGIRDPEERAGQYPHQLSGGLRQRALIASAVAAGPRVLIADEPTTALDVTVQAQVLELLAELKREGTALLLVSHDLAVVSELADEIIVLRAGAVIERGTPAQILHNPQADYTRQLLDAVPSAHTRGERLSPLPPAVFTRPRVAEREGVQRVGETRPAPILEARNLVKSYPATRGRRTTVLHDVSFTLERGKTLGIVGESGSGKSTAAAIALGLTPADTGEVLLDGEAWSRLREKDRRARRRRIQTISQDPLGSFDPRSNVRTLLGEALSTVGVPRGERDDAATALLEQVGLSAVHLGRHPLELSGGQRQRIAIAQALATNPEIIVCDEPVSALDVSIQAQVLDLLRDLQDQLHVSLLFISHDLGVVRHIAHDVAVMQHGRIVEFGETGEVFDHPQHPYTRDLIAAIPTIGTPTPAI